jgi:uncharacterized C2H2 Zn-finger protein
MEKPHVCPRCGYACSIANDFRKHLNKKNLCPANVSDCSLDTIKSKYEQNKDIKYNCSICQKGFSSKSGVQYHLKGCSQKKYINDLKAELRKEITAEISNSDDGSSNNEREEKTNNSQEGKLSIIEKKLEKMTLELEYYRNRKKEGFYQKALETFFNATHKRLVCGETDITTDEFHAEIKEWCSYKEAIGQLLCYNTVDPRPQLRVYLFGKYGEKQKKVALEIMKVQNIIPYEFIDEENNTMVRNLLTQETQEVYCVDNKMI